MDMASCQISRVSVLPAKAGVVADERVFLRRRSFGAIVIYIFFDFDIYT